jgi:F-type H+-transporting ATPase subunit b
MKRVPRQFGSALALLVLVAAYGVAPAQALRANQAQSQAATQAPNQSEDQPGPEDSAVGIVFRWLNFAIVFGGLGYLIAKNAPAFFGARARKIGADIAAAAAAKAEADAQLRAAETRLARLDQDTAAMRGEARREFAGETERLRAASHQELERIQQAADAEIQAARRAARLELRELAARLAAESAAELVPQRITAAQRAALLRNFVEGLPARSAN